MSRKIEQKRIDSGDLTEAEILYLQQRDQLPAHIQPINTGQYMGTPVTATANTGTVATMSTEELEAELDRRRRMDEAADEGRGFQDSAVPGVHIPQRKDAQHVHPTGGTPVPLRDELLGPEPEVDGAKADFSNTSGEDDGDEEEGYETWRNDDLRAEIARRNEGRAEADKLSLDGKKADLIATLEADDEAYEEQ